MNIIIVAGIILTVVQILKVTFNVGSRYIPILSFGVMIVLFISGWFYLGQPKVALDVIINNIESVLIAMGLWSGTKALIGK